MLDIFLVFELQVVYFKIMFVVTGFVQVLENLESSGILLENFLGLESPGKLFLKKCTNPVVMIIWG